MRLFVNEKEIPALVEAIERYIATTHQCSEAQVLLERILVCIEKQGRHNAK